MSDYAMPGVLEIRVTAEEEKASEITEFIREALAQRGYEMISKSPERHITRTAARRHCFSVFMKEDVDATRD